MIFVVAIEKYPFELFLTDSFHPIPLRSVALSKKRLVRKRKGFYIKTADSGTGTGTGRGVAHAPPSYMLSHHLNEFLLKGTHRTRTEFLGSFTDLKFDE